MSRDIYADYLEVVKNANNTSIEQKYNNEVINSYKPSTMDFTNDEAIKVLREISSKLDNFSIKENNYVENSPINTVQVPQGEIDLAIVNGNVVIPDNGVFMTDVYINNGRIYSLGKNDFLKAREVIDASGKYVIPGVIDPHVHLGLFESLERELETETKAALLGGVTTVGCFFGSETSHFNTFPATIDLINNRSKVDIIPHLVISSDEHRKEISDYIEHLGVTSFKLYMNGIPGLIPDVDDGFILDVFQEIKKSDKECIVCSHSENRYMVRRANNLVREEKGDKASVADWSDTHPEMAEEEAVMRLAYLAEKMGVSVYFVHISTAAAIERLRKLKPFNKYVNVETTSPYLSVTKNSAMDNSIKMEPPFREAKDVEELWKAVEDGIVDTIGTDNVTMTKAEKNMDKSMWEAIPGYPALETHLPVLLHEGVVKRGIDLEKIVSRITKKPAETFNIYPKKGTILPGSDADVVIVDLNLSKVVRASERATRSDFSIYENKEIQGWPITTIKSGEIVVRNGQYLDKKVNGKYISR